MAFHCGVLRWLAETSRLEQVAHISSVSGGTLVAGLVMATNDWKWPTSREYLDRIGARLKCLLTEKDIGRAGLLLLLLPKNWRYLLSRANVLSQAIEHCWGIKACLSDLPENPVWSINGTTAETGRRFRFKLTRCGDYELGYADARAFKVADAMAVSAALPGVIGPLTIKTDNYVWKKRPRWDAAPECEEPVKLSYRRLHIYDGGIYDNLALEPLMNTGTQRLKNNIAYLVCSDAGAPLKRVAPGPSLSPFRALRILDIAVDQARALRIRPLVNFLLRNPGGGTYAQIGANPIEHIQRFASYNPLVAAELLRREWLGPEDIEHSANHRTTLHSLTNEQFVRLEQHGYECIQWNELLFAVGSTT